MSNNNDLLGKESSLIQKELIKNLKLIKENDEIIDSMITILSL